MNGKITVESGDYKAVFEIENNVVQLNFEPAQRNEPRNENEQFVMSATSLIMTAIQSNKR